jgi:hypothetical protein
MIIISTTLQELEAAAELADTGGGCWLPMPVVIRTASHAWQYLRIIYDQHTARDRLVALLKFSGSTGAQYTVELK